MADISLNAGIRSNLLQLQNSSKLFNQTTDRLSSGKKVNSAIDNPTNFFASVNLTDRADALGARLDGMGQAIQRIQAADNGITTIRSFVSAMKGVVNNALGNSDADARDALGAQFNELIVQISSTAKDSGYQGINLLERNETETVQFNETFDSSVLDVKGFDLQGPGSDGRGVVDASGNVASAAITANIVQASVASAASTASVASAAAITATSASTASAAGTISAGETIYTATGTAAVTVQVTADAQTGYDGTAATNSVASNTVSGAYTASVASTASAAGASIAASTASVASAASIASAASAVTSAVALALDTQDGDAVGILGANSAGGAGMVDWGGTDYKTDLASIVQQLEAFDEALKTQASNLAQNLSTITIREEFSNELINTLSAGSDKLTLADLNEEGANLLALQTSQALATQSLSLASQQSQQVLQLLG